MDENLNRVKSIPKTSDREFDLKTKALLAPSVPFKDHKKVVFVDTEEGLEHFLSVLNLSEPHWVGVDIEHSKSCAYHGLICLIQVSWPIQVKGQTVTQTFLIDTLAFTKE